MFDMRLFRALRTALRADTRSGTTRRIHPASLGGRTKTALALACLAGSTASATTIPFTEDFTVGAANWRDASGLNVVSWNPAGGPDGGAYASTSFLVTQPPPPNGAIVFRGHDNFDSSGDAFTGNWISSGISEFSFSIRHDGPAPLDVFARFATSANFPGAIGLWFVPVLPNTWTDIVIPVGVNSPNIILEGFPYEDVFSAIGNVQIGILPSDLFAKFRDIQIVLKDALLGKISFHAKR